MRSIFDVFVVVMIIIAFTACEDPNTQTKRAAKQAIVFLDELLEIEDLVRTEELSKKALIGYALEAAYMATRSECEVEGVLAGIYLRQPKKKQGEIIGKWFGLDGIPRGHISATYWVGDSGGKFSGNWNNPREDFAGYLSGSYWTDQTGFGEFKGQWSTKDQQNSGMLQGMQVRLDVKGGILFGVWTHCQGIMLEEGDTDLDEELVRIEAEL